VRSNRPVDPENLMLLVVAALVTILFWSVIAKFCFIPLMEYMARAG
jgi:hypothetical protein